MEVNTKDILHYPQLFSGNEVLPIYLRLHNKIMGILNCDTTMEHYNNPEILTNKKLRESLDVNHNCLTNTGNMRDRKISKSSGLCNVYFESSSTLIKAHPKILSIFTQLYKTESLVIPKLERPLYKPKGSLKSDLSSTWLYNKPWQPEYQAFLCILGNRSDVDVRKSAKFVLLENYSIYADILDPYLQEKGLIKSKADRTVYDKLVIKNIDFYNILLQYIMEFTHKTPYVTKHNDIIQQEAKLILCKTPKYILDILPKTYNSLKLVTFTLKSGDFLVWKARDPYISDTNNASVHFSGLFISMIPATKEWYNSKERQEMVLWLNSGTAYPCSSREGLSNNAEYQRLTLNGTKPYVHILNNIESNTPNIESNNAIIVKKLYSIIDYDTLETPKDILVGVNSRELSRWSNVDTKEKRMLMTTQKPYFQPMVHTKTNKLRRRRKR